MGKKNVFRQAANIATLGLFNAFLKPFDKPSVPQPQTMSEDINKQILTEEVKDIDLLELKKRRRKGLLSTILTSPLSNTQENKL